MALLDTYFVKSLDHPGWIRDLEHEDFISPSGRTAPYPGAPFTGSVTKDELELIKQLTEEEIVEKSPQKQEENNMALSAKILKTYKVGDVTVNIIRVD